MNAAGGVPVNVAGLGVADVATVCGGGVTACGIGVKEFGVEGIFTYFCSMSQDYRNIYLAIMAIEGGAEKMHLSGRDMYLRLKKQGLVHNYLLKCYDELHTQSKEWLADTTVEALKNWESAAISVNC